MEAILLSGGLDSIALTWWLRPPVALTINYGQVSAAAEVRASAQIASLLNIRHEVLTADVRHLGAGDLAGTKPHSLAPETEWWPFRNQLLVTLAGMRAISLGVTRLLIGTVRTDEFHADGTQAFMTAIDSLCSLQEGNLRVAAPAIKMTSSELIRKSQIPRDHLAWAHSCHRNSLACGLCRGCDKHRMVMDELGYDVY